MDDLLALGPDGLYSPRGGFHIDPWRPVARAVTTHAHSDHARRGCGAYLSTPTGALLLRQRMLPGAAIEALPYGEPREINGVRVSLHPAGHVLGSAQVRLEHGGRVAVVTGDYKLEPTTTAEPWEPVRCDLMVTESTFALPVYRWRPEQETMASINDWWRGNRREGRASMLFAYALGKAQRLLAGLDATIGPILVHGALLPMIEAYRAAGIALPPVLHATAENARAHRAQALVIAPPGADGTPWARKFAPASTAFASGWMAVRGRRRRRALDRGFVLSDHADWPGLLRAIEASGATQVWVTHGYSEVLARYLRGRGLDARAVETRFAGEDGAEEPATGEEPAP